MKILHVIRSIDPFCGGPTSAFRGLVPEQVRLNDEIHALTSTIPAFSRHDPIGAYLKEMDNDPVLQQIDVTMLKGFGRKKPWNSFAWTPGARRWARQYFSDPRTIPDIIHIHAVFTHSYGVVAAEARRRGVPYIIEPHGNLDSTSFEMKSYRLKKAFTRLVMQKDLDHAAGIRASSTFEARELENWVDPEKIRFIPHGVELPEFDRDEAAARFFDAYPAMRGRRFILCLARLHPVKRIDLVIQALAQVRRDHPDMALVVIGQDGGDLKHLQKEVDRLGLQNDVLFTGFLDGPIKEGAYAAATVFALTSIHENFGISLLEAMAHGLPSIATPEVGAAEHLEIAGGGLIAEGTPEGIAAGIRKILEANLREMGDSARTHVQREFSWPSIARQMREWYEELVEKQKSAVGK